MICILELLTRTASSTTLIKVRLDLIIRVVRFLSGEMVGLGAEGNRKYVRISCKESRELACHLLKWISKDWILSHHSGVEIIQHVGFLRCEVMN